MTRQERLVRAESIERRQRAGKITPWQAAEEFDLLLMADTHDLIFYSDSTGHTAPWDRDVMLFSKTWGDVPAGWIDSNTGVVCRGPRRGMIVTYPEGQCTNCHPNFLKHFGSRAAQRPS